MKKLIVVFICICALTFSLAACSGSNLPDWADEEHLTQEAQEVVKRASDRDFTYIADRFSSNITAEDLSKSMTPDLDSFGEFDKVNDISLETTSDETAEYAAVFLAVEYANYKVVYQVNFTENDEICGLFLHNKTEK